MRQQLGRDQAVGQRIVDLMREVDLDIGELPVLFDGDRRRQANAADPVFHRFRLAVNLREDDRHAEIERFHAGQAERLGDRRAHVDVRAIEEAGDVILITAEGDAIAEL